jgi:hypothetical protein
VFGGGLARGALSHRPPCHRLINATHAAFPKQKACRQDLHHHRHCLCSTTAHDLMQCAALLQRTLSLTENSLSDRYEGPYKFIYGA